MGLSLLTLCHLVLLRVNTPLRIIVNRKWRHIGPNDFLKDFWDVISRPSNVHSYLFFSAHLFLLYVAALAAEQPAPSTQKYLSLSHPVAQCIHSL